MNDLISRQAAIDALDGGFNITGRKNAETIRDYINGVAKKLRELPSAERRGRWIKDKNLYKCTACNDLLTVAGWADCIPEKQIYTAFKYCPNCGAKMEGKDDDEE